MLLVGRNGCGKTTVALALEVLQKIARGTNRISELVAVKDFARNRSDVPMRFELDVEIKTMRFTYVVAFELIAGSKAIRVLEEKLSVNGKPIFSREQAKVELAIDGEWAAEFFIDWHLVALPIVQEMSLQDPLFIFRQWLRRMIILRPIPVLIGGESKEETLQPNTQMTDFAAWFSGLIAETPSAYNRINEYLKQVMPDLEEIKNPVVGVESRSLAVQFSNDQGSMTVPFGDLSDGEKCFMICALVVAANVVNGPILCFWDEPDNYLAMEEVGHFVVTLRKAFQAGGQFIATSHNAETIRNFSDENTLLLARKSHLEPTQVRLIKDMSARGDLVGAMARGDLEL